LLPTFWHKFTFCSGSPALNSEISIHSIHQVAYPRSFILRPWTLKSHMVRGKYDLFTATHRSTLLLPSFSHKFTFFSGSPFLNAEIWMHSIHHIAYPCSFNLRPWTLKSDIIRGKYDLFTAAHRSTVLLPSSHKFTFFSGSPFLNAEIWMHWIHHVAYPRSSNLRPWKLKSDIVWGSYHLLIAGHQSTLLMPTF
jgi:hypothetical protein